ncbi:hypothetical protein BO99DRAFT_184314 [Aspergillus violaceofuscus CBS 115571]|uniref:Uncharacterized protein n=1 Tax=Aspergillus violaceofuscus (strain CBS 115571) TaxID=1450538 RepID=A0A2V5H6Y9_ASPV1|nr:hypothetical protein BO99DRAFT_184314 [Aspergillus violaceofuscus CBS 115571]
MSFISSHLLHQQLLIYYVRMRGLSAAMQGSLPIPKTGLFSTGNQESSQRLTIKSTKSLRNRPEAIEFTLS